MRAHNLNAKSMQIGENQCWVLQLGESGKDRKQPLVRCEENIQDGEFVSYAMPGDNVAYTWSPGEPWDAIIMRSTEDSPKGFIMRVSSYCGYSRDANGHVAFLKSGPKPVVLATSYEAFGRCGLWRDVIIAAEPGTVLQVQHKSYKPDYLIVTENGVFKLSQPQAEEKNFSTHVADYTRI